MNRQSIAFKLKIFSAVIIILAAFTNLYLFQIMYNKNTFYPTVNKGRLLTSSAVTEVQKCIAVGDFNTTVKCNYKYTAVNLSGKVLMSSISEYKKNTIVNLNEFIQYDKRFSLKNPELVKYSEPLIANNKQEGTVVFYIPKKEFLINQPVYETILELSPVIIFLIIIISMILYLCVFGKKNILVPIKNLNESARRILKGDFSYKIKYDYENEMGSFCHDFEAMRDELKFSKEKEAEIKRNEKELLACISHDIKTPLTAIGGYVSGIKDGIVKDREGIENYCNVILKRVKMLTKLLEDILEYSKAELNQMNIQLSEFYSRDYLINILDDLSVEIQSKGLKFTPPSQIPDLMLNGDKKRISEVLYNLVSNSIKYSKENGEISIYFETEKNYLKVYVKDAGIGIASADMPNIFNKFYRGEKSRNQNIPGSGLGLSICKYIVEAHGGFINCIESSAKGTTMCFSLPL